MKRPNILIIKSDSHNPKYMGAHGHPIIKTPSLDRLAESGVRFDAAYCNSPICVPSRAAMLTGKLPETTGYRYNWGPNNFLQDGHVSLPAHFAVNGYNTCAIGVTHTNSYDQSQGWMQRYAPMNPRGTGFIHGDMPLVGERIKGASWTREYDSCNVIHSWEKAGMGNVCAPRMDQITTEMAENFLSDWLTGSFNFDKGASPLFLFVGYECPHYPYNAPAEYFLHYRDKMELPPYAKDCKELYHAEDERYLDRYIPGWRSLEYPPDKILDSMAAYYGMTSYLDAQIERLIGMIERFSNREEWIIIYTSDHGEMLGERGLWMKVVPYESSIRTPLAISWKNTIEPNRSCAKPVSLVDVYPTLCGLTGIDFPEQEIAFDGVDFSGYLFGKQNEPEVPQAVCQTYQRGSQFQEENWKEGLVLTEVVRKDNWKLIHHHETDEKRLYDLSQDSEEVNDLNAETPHECPMVFR